MQRFMDPYESEAMSEESGLVDLRSPHPVTVATRHLQGLHSVSFISIYPCIGMYIYTYIYTHAHTHTHILYLCAYSCIHIYTYPSLHICIHVYMCISV